MLESVASVVSVFALISSIFVSCEWVEIVPIRTGSAASLETSTSLGILDTSAELTTPISVSPNLPKPKFRPSSAYANVTSEDSERNEEEESSDLKKAGFLQFLQAVQENLLQYKFRGRKNKMDVLNDLNDQLLVNIKERIKNLWKPTSAEAREYKDEDYHMDFPSNEGALMTIGFLTFAVFLIKLVIKLIHAIKYKKQFFGNASTTTTTTAASVIFVKKREIDDEVARISQYIEEYTLS